MVALDVSRAQVTKYNIMLLCRRLATLDRLLTSIPIEQHLQFHPSLLAILETCANPDFLVANSIIDAVQKCLGQICRSRIDRIPAVLVKGYTTMLLGRHYRNQPWNNKSRIQDLLYSEVVQLLPTIDGLLGTSLAAHWANANRSPVQPFPFLSLPAELRIRVYSLLVPDRAHVSWDFLTQGDSPPTHSTVHNLLNLVCTSRQIYDEVTHQYYQHKTLLIETSGINLGQDQYYRHAVTYAFLAALPPRTRAFFKTLEIRLTSSFFADMKWKTAPPGFGPWPEDSFSAALLLLPNLEAIHFSFAKVLDYRVSNYWRNSLHIESVRLESTLNWMIDRIPNHVQLRWSFLSWQLDRLSDELKMKVESRGGFHQCGRTECPKLDC